MDQDCALLIQPGDIHQDHLKANQIHYVVHFQILTTPGSQSIERILRKGCRANQQVARMPSPNDDSWLDEIASESVGNLYSGNIQDALLEVIVWRILRHFPQTIFDGVFFQHTAARQFVETVYAMISSHLYERFTVSALASKMEVSERTLTSKCSEILHESPATIIRTLKIEEAKRLLRIGNPTVKEVAYHLGYSNPFHFSQVFKNATGITPKSWRSEQGISRSPSIKSKLTDREEEKEQKINRANRF